MNFNISAYRVLYILLLLVRHRSVGMMELNNYLLNNSHIGRAFNSETITKYINTLRHAGCNIPRASSRNNFCYQLKQNPFPLKFTPEELRVAHQVLLHLSAHPDESLYLQYHELLQKVAWMIGEEQHECFLFETDHVLAPPEVQKRRRLVNQYKKYCVDAMVLELTYQPNSYETLKMTIEPNRVIQEGKHSFLIGTDRNYFNKVKINIEKITHVDQLPFKAKHHTKYIPVVFQLKGRLAKTYRLYLNEVVVSKQGDTLRIKSKTDDVSSLIKRLLKYGDACEVISPAYAREEAHNKIRQLLEGLKTKDFSKV